MQNYGQQQQQQGYQRPGSTTSFAGQTGPPPPPYGAPQGYQSSAPQGQSQWAPPAQNQAPTQQWNQQQQVAGGYNPGVYGAMPGGYAQGQQAPNQASNTYTQQQDIPPPPPPKPAGFAAAVQQQHQTQNWGQQPAYGAQQPQQQSYQSPQQNASHAQPGQQGGYNQQGGFQNQGTPQQTYNSAAPPPPSQTPGGSYFPPSQSHQQQGRPGSVYGAEQVGTYSSPAAAAPQQPPSSVMSPNEQQPAYIPPSLTGQGVQSYMPANTNPMPGVYVPPPPDIPAWQQAQHAPLQGGKKFQYTKPTVDPKFYAQGYQGVQPMQQGQGQGQYAQQPAQNQFTAQGQMQPQGQAGQPGPGQFPQSPPQQQGQFGQPMQPQQNQYSQQTQTQIQTQIPQHAPPQHNQPPQAQQNISPVQYHQPQNQWQPTPPADQGYVQKQNVQSQYGTQQPTQQQQAWQPGHQAQGSEQGIQAPRPINGHTGTMTPGFVNQPSPQSQPVSPVQNRQSISFGSGQSQASLGRTGSVSSIALGAIHAQRAGNRTESPKPPAPKVPTPPPPRDDKSKFSALGGGGPSDWEHFGMGEEEVDDEEYFVTKKDERKDEPAQLDSVELPAQQPAQQHSPGPTHEWPTPPTQPAPLNLQRRETFQPTPPPPPKSAETPAQRPGSQPPQHAFVMGDAPPPSHQPQQSFVMGDAVSPPQSQHGFIMGDASITPSSTQSPQPAQHTQPPPAQQGFVMDGGEWTAPKQGTPAQQQPQHQPPPSAQQGFVMGDGGWSAHAASSHQRQQTPTQNQPQPPPATNAFVMGDGGWASQQASNQASGGWEAQSNQHHAAELKAKDEAYERLKADSDKEKTDLQAELSQLKVVIEATKSHAESERNVLHEQIESMRTAAEQTKSNADNSHKEKESMIERLKEDAEGKDDTIKERDTTIADLRGQLREKDATIDDLNQQMETERSKEAPKPTPADLIPDIDPWYAGSLERFIGMLRSEANEPNVEDKIKVFRAFLSAESGVRGLEYYSTPPPAPVPQSPLQTHSEQSFGASREPTSPAKKRDLNVQVPPPEQSPQEDFQYSPGGRPILRHQPTMKSEETIPTQQSFNSFGEPSAQSTTVLTPTSSQDDELNKTPTPMQSPPEEQPQPQYKAYVPPGVSQADSTKSLHRQSVSFANVPPIAPLQPSGSGKNNDEIFFGHQEPQAATKSASRPTTAASEIPVPAPLFTAQPAATPAPAPAPPPAQAPKKGSTESLADLIPAQIASPQPNPPIEEIRKKTAELSSDFSFIQELTNTWEKSASLARKKNDDARRKRQEESEAQTDELFNSHEISYADIGDIEDEFKEKERELKAQEDREEYKTYVENVFDKVYDELQSQIKSLMDLYVQAETIVHTSVSGIRSLEGGDAATTEESLKLLGRLHEHIEARHDKVVQAVSERDKRYKKTEVQPLYAAGNIAKMKNVEKHFDNAEKQAMARAKGEQAERVGELVHVAEEVVVSAVGVEQGEIDRIIAAIRDIPDKLDEELLTRARETLLALKSSSKSLLSLFNILEIDLNTAVLEAEIAQARLDSTAPSKIEELEREMEQGEKKLKEEFERRVGVIEQDKDEIDRLIEEKGGKVKRSEEDEKKFRMNKALEEAKRRNGDL